jgi:hypothetical protein
MKRFLLSAILFACSRSPKHDYLVSADPDIRVPIDATHSLVDRGGNDVACDVGCLVLGQREATAATKSLAPADAGPEAAAAVMLAVKPTLDDLPDCWARCAMTAPVRWRRP